MKIDKGIPVPETRAGRPYAVDYTAMEIGDSYFVPLPQNRALNGPYYHSKKTGRKFTSRKVTENGITGTRVWRVE